MNRVKSGLNYRESVLILGWNCKYCFILIHYSINKMLKKQ